MKYLILLFFILFGTFCWSQEVIVYNAKTGVPVDGVLIFSNNFTTQTNILGEANLEYFKNTENIFFQHSSFLKHTSTKAKILKQGNTVLLIEDPVKIDEIVISVNRREQAKSEIPNTISTINIEEVIHSNPQTTADLLSTKGGIFIQKSQLGGGSPMIRGFSANRILLVIDGIRMNNAIYRSGNLHNVISLDANAIENTEIIYGPGSVIYGSDALGGVLCFNTLKPQLSTSELYKLSNHVLTRYSSANNEKPYTPILTLEKINGQHYLMLHTVILVIYKWDQTARENTYSRNMFRNQNLTGQTLLSKTTIKKFKNIHGTIK